MPVQWDTEAVHLALDNAEALIQKALPIMQEAAEALNAVQGMPGLPHYMDQSLNGVHELVRTFHGRLQRAIEMVRGRIPEERAVETKDDGPQTEKLL